MIRRVPTIDADVRGPAAAFQELKLEERGTRLRDFLTIAADAIGAAKSESSLTGAGR
jgi:hypothetical protein